MSYTNTSLVTARRCLTEFDFGYMQQLELVDADSEALQVGTCWHKAHDVFTKVQNQVIGSTVSPIQSAYNAIAKTAPSAVWIVKLQRMFAGYQAYWDPREKLILQESEHTFKVHHKGMVFEGQLDGILSNEDGRRGMLERKTTGFDIGPFAPYWDKLRMDVQTGLYSLALDFVPHYILYDVVRKPTINPKRISKADFTRMLAEVGKRSVGMYYGEPFSMQQIDEAHQLGKETPELYGARLGSDISANPDKYFARRPVERTGQDYASLLHAIESQVHVIEYAKRAGMMHRNPDQCNAFGKCRFFSLCSNNIRPNVGDPAPDGFRHREHLHPELAPQEG